MRTPTPPRAPRARVPIRARTLRASLPYWLAVLALAAATGLLVASLLRRVDVAEDRSGPTEVVLVATEPMAPGDRFEAGRVQLRPWPRSMIPDGALTEVPEGGTASAGIARGEVVVAERVSGPGSASPAGRMPPDRRALAVPVPVPGLPVRIGDRVDLHSTAGEGGGGPVAAEATVLAVSRDSVTVAVTEEAAPLVAAALGRGTVVLALRSPG